WGSRTAGKSETYRTAGGTAAGGRSGGRAGRRAESGEAEPLGRYRRVQPATFNFQPSTIPISTANRPDCFDAVAPRAVDPVVKVHGWVAVGYDELEPVSKAQVIVSVSYFEDPVFVAAKVIFHARSFL